MVEPVGVLPLQVVEAEVEVEEAVPCDEGVGNGLPL
jgi:hypothetical protein